LDGKTKGSGKGKFKGKKHVPEKANYLEYEDYEDEDEYEEANVVEDDYDDDDDAYEVGSDDGASQDEDVAEAYAAYDQARAQLKDQQKRRGFFKATGTLTFEERKAAIKKEKAVTSCAACGQKGHWAGDDACPKKDQSKPRADLKQVHQRGKIAMGKGGGKQRGKKRPEQGFFVLDDADYEEAESFMVRDSPAPAADAAEPAADAAEEQLPVPAGDGRPVGRGAAAEITPSAPFTLEELDVESDDTCRSQRCRCHWCKRALLRQLGVRPTLRSRAEDNGLDMDEPGWVCTLRSMGEISDEEWSQIMEGWEHSSDSRPESEAPETAPEPYCS
jgi:hypothetical protein